MGFFRTSYKKGGTDAAGNPRDLSTPAGPAPPLNAPPPIPSLTSAAGSAAVAQQQKRRARSILGAIANSGGVLGPRPSGKPGSPTSTTTGRRSPIRTTRDAASASVIGFQRMPETPSSLRSSGRVTRAY